MIEGCVVPSTEILTIGFLLLVQSFSVQTNQWSEWGSWTACTKSCNGGTLYRTRKCVPADTCGDGDSVRYKVCNTQICPTGASDIRSEQCRTYDSVVYRGRRYKWKPVINPASPCSLTCVSDNNQHTHLSPLILDGTECRNRSDHVCLGEKCLRVGCDSVINSTKVVDECGVCGGDGSTCRATMSRYTWKVAGYGRCSVSCGEGVQHSTAICTNKKTGKFIDAYFCATFRPPPSTRKKCVMEPCRVTDWYSGQWSRCSVSCGGGISWRHVYCVEKDANGYRKYAHASYCHTSRPKSEKRCNVGSCPVWYTGEWSPCTATCGKSSQYREVMCHHSKNYTCDDSVKPDAVRMCSANVPCPITTSATSKTSLDDTKYGAKPSFYTSAWSACSATCNIGMRSRYVECKVFHKFSDHVKVVSDDACSGPKPHTTEECFERFCQTNHIPEVVVEPPKDGHSNKDYYWRYADFTRCSKSCMRGRQDSMTECVRVVDIKVVNPTYCSGIPGLVTVSRVCNDIPCPPEWKFHSYSNCSDICGGGKQHKLYRCIHYSTTKYIPTVVPDYKCNKRPQLSYRKCNRHPCPPTWKTGKWLPCTVTCGMGKQVRKVMCIRRTGPKEIDVADRGLCDISTKPEMQRMCMADCKVSVASIKGRKETFIQLAKNRKVVVRVGGEAIVIPRTTIIVRCPVRNFNRKLIHWSHKEKRVRVRGRVKALRNGSLRIRNSKDIRDAGLYTCYASLQNATIKITFHSTADAVKKAKYRRKYFKNKSVKKPYHKLPVSNITYVNDKSISRTSWIKDGKIRKSRRSKTKRVVVATPWSPCSKSCSGYGAKTRHVTCERLSEKFTRIMSMHVCKKRGLVIPVKKKSCHASVPCPTWFTDIWSKCSESKCVKTDYAMQMRNVLCRSYNGTQLDDSSCNPKSKPDTIKVCRNIGCKPKWNMSKWSKTAEITRPSAL